MIGGLTPRQVAQRLGGEASGHSILAPGPGHGPKDRSLSILISWQAPEGFVVHSHAGDDPIVCRDYVKAKLGLETSRRREVASCRREVSKGTAEIPQSDDAAKKARAAALLSEGVDPGGTIVERYLMSRSLREANLPLAIRFHPRCPWRDDAGEIIRVPAMLAAMRNIITNELTAVHRTRLTAEGVKVDRRMLGVAAGAAIKLDADDTVTAGLVIGEGIETALAARQLGLRPAWALGSTGGITAFPVLAGIECLTVLAEVDAASDRAVEAVAARWHAAGREVRVITPRNGKDVNDAIRGAA